MKLDQFLLRLVDEEFESDSDYVLTNIEDIRASMRRGEDWSRSSHRALRGDAEIGVSSVMEVMESIVVTWAAWSALMEMKKAVQGVDLRSTTVTALVWAEHLEKHGLPKALSQRIATKYSNELKHLELP